MDAKKRKTLKEMGMREQCARCQCEQRWHRKESQNVEFCGVCGEWCPYKPAWIEVDA